MPTRMDGRFAQVIDSDHVIAIVAERSPDAGDRHDRGVAKPIAHYELAQQSKRSL